MNRNAPPFVIGFVAALCIVFGAGVAAVHYATTGLLARNEALHRNRVLCEAFGLDIDAGLAEAYAAAVAQALEEIELNTSQGPMTVYRNRRQRTVGFEFSGMGFWDRIEGVLVLDEGLETVRGIRFTSQKETPGLGARIEEPSFLGQFAGLRVAWDAPSGERVVVGASGGTGSNRVDAITGASQTSFALMRLLNAELARFRDAWRAARATGGLAHG